MHYNSVGHVAPCCCCAAAAVAAVFVCPSIFYWYIDINRAVPGTIVPGCSRSLPWGSFMGPKKNSREGGGPESSRRSQLNHTRCQVHTNSIDTQTATAGATLYAYQIDYTHRGRNNREQQAVGNPALNMTRVMYRYT